MSLFKPNNSDTDSDNIENTIIDESKLIKSEEKVEELQNELEENKENTYLTLDDVSTRLVELHSEFSDTQTMLIKGLTASDDLDIDISLTKDNINKIKEDIDNLVLQLDRQIDSYSTDKHLDDLTRVMLTTTLNTLKNTINEVYTDIENTQNSIDGVDCRVKVLKEHSITIKDKIVDSFQKFITVCKDLHILKLQNN